MNDIRDSAELEPRPFVNYTIRVSDCFRDLEPVPQRWEAGMPIGAAIMFLFAASGVGKTWFALHLAVCIAAGIDCLGFQTKRCVVYYFAGEGAAGIPQRIRAILEGLGLSWVDLDDWLFIRIVPTDVSDYETRAQFARELIAHGANAPGLLIFDTTSAHAPSGFNENEARDTTAMLAAYRNVGREYDAGVMLVTHTGHANGPAGERMRGSSALFAAADVTLKLSKLGDVTRAISWEKTRDSASRDPLKFTMKAKFGGVVIEPIDVSGDDDSALTPSDRAVLLALVLHGDGAPRRAKDWERKADALGVSHSPFYRSQKKLLAGSYVLAAAKGYLLTLKGQEIVDAVQVATGDGDLVPQYQTGTTRTSGTAKNGTTSPLSLERGSGTSAKSGRMESVPRSQFGTTSVPGTTTVPESAGRPADVRSSGGALPPVDEGYWDAISQEGAA